MGPHDRDIAYLRELAERLNQTPDTDPDNLSIRFNDLSATLDRFMRVVAETDPNVPAQYQMEAADQGTNDNLRIYEILAVYMPQLIGAEEVRALKWLNGIRARVQQQNEDVTPQAVTVLLELTDHICSVAEQFDGTAAAAPARSATFVPTSAAGAEQPQGEAQTALGYSNPAANRVNVQALKAPSLSTVDPRMLIGGAIVVVLLAVGIVFLLTRGAASPSAAARTTQTPLAQISPGLNLTPTPLPAVTSSGDIAQATVPPEAPPTDTPVPAPPPAAAARWTTTDALNLRSDASTTADIIRALPAGTIVTTADDNGDQTVEDIEWLHVVDDQNNTGWVAKQYLQPAQ